MNRFYIQLYARTGKQRDTRTDAVGLEPFCYNLNLLRSLAVTLVPSLSSILPCQDWYLIHQSDDVDCDLFKSETMLTLGE